MTHHIHPPTRASDLREGDTVTVPGAVTGKARRYETRTPCCLRPVRISAADIAYMARRPRCTVSRECKGCGWPYEIHVESPSAFGATFTVMAPPRAVHSKP